MKRLHVSNALHTVTAYLSLVAKKTAELVEPYQRMVLSQNGRE